MSRTFKMRQGDTEPSLGAIVKDSKGRPKGLTNVSDVRFHMMDADDGSIKIDGHATVVNASEGKIVYEWQDGDTDTPGHYDAEFEIIYDDGDTETFPNYRYIDVIITEEIA